MNILDIETDGLMDTVTKIHCAVILDTKTGLHTEFTPDTIRELPKFLDSLLSLSCHNGIGFDLKVLKKLLNYEYKGKYYDTLLLSRILFPDIEGGHSVEAWGDRLGEPKGRHTDWSKFSQEMLTYCIQDCRTQGKIWEFLTDKMQEYSACDSRIANKWQTIIDMEQKVWKLMEAQADYGWEFNLELAYKLTDQLSQKCVHIEDKLVKTLPPRVIQVTKTESGATKAFKADGSLTEAAKKIGDANICGDFCKVLFEPFNLGSSAQIKDYLLSRGWEPSEYNYKKDKHNKPIRGADRQLIKASPKAPNTAEKWEEVAHMLNNPDIGLLAEYNKASHRLSQINGLISATRSDHRIESQVNSCATNTARMTHRVVVNIPKAAEGIYYGREMRSLFTAGEGNILVGCDASAIEARCEAHYIHEYDPAAALELVAGDIHTKNAEIWGVDRNTAKSGKYAILYGCSPTKLASVLRKPIKEANDLYKSYWEANEASKALKEALESEYEEKGYIVAIDGRPLAVRYKHALLNTLLQSCGAIILKLALCYFNNAVKKRGLKAHIVGVFHDEFQTEVTEGLEEDIGGIAMWSMKQAGKHLNMNVEIEAEYKSGKTWANTH